MNDAQAKARFRIMMLIAELQEAAESSADPREHERVENILLNAIDALAERQGPHEGPALLIAPPGRA